MSWMLLILAGIFEMLGVNAINVYTHKKTKKALLGILFFFGISFISLTLAMEQIAMSTAYAVWTGIGAAGGAILGMLFYNEPKNFPRIFFIAFIIGSAVGLKAIS